MTNFKLPDDDTLFLRAALHIKVITEADIEIGLSIQESMKDLGVLPKPIADILLEKGVLTSEQRADLMARVDRVKKAHRIPGYRLKKRLGRGSMGTVYKAEQMEENRTVAIKILSPWLAEDAAYVRRFRKEARVIRTLNHPNIVQGFDAGEADGTWYFAMEFVKGATLLSILRRGAMDEIRALNVVTQVARALSHAYDRDLVHRDVKPDNIMIVAGGVAKLCDLGLAKDVQRAGESTERGVALGTPNYISPEQVRGEIDVDIRSDIYSLGATLYHALAGVAPFDGTNAAVIMVKHLNEPPIPPRQRVAGISRDTERIVMKMLAKNPLDRYQTPSELLMDLENARARLLGESEPFPRSSRRR